MYCAELAKGNEKRFGCSLFEKYGRIFLIEAFGPAEEAGARLDGRPRPREHPRARGSAPA